MISRQLGHHERRHGCRSGEAHWHLAAANHICAERDNSADKMAALTYTRSTSQANATADSALQTAPAAKLSS
jgi:hypothetical protein